MTGTGARVRWVLTRAVEAVLAVAGLAFTLFGDENPASEAIFLSGWLALALPYLIIGWFTARKQRHWGDAEPIPLTWRYGRAARRIAVLFTVGASLTGLSAALAVVASDDESDIDSLVIGLGVVAVFCAWALLHLGYARYYSQWDDLWFPGTDRPQLVDYLYFSFTIGVSFAVSDVEVRGRALRWHVMVHCVVSFFYNAAVLAVAVGIITRR